jgi:hypothetical protein
MVKRLVRCIAMSVLALAVCIGGFTAYLYAYPVPYREFDDAWYHSTTRKGAEDNGRSFLASHRFAVLHAQADHFLHPIGPGRIIGVWGATTPDSSGNVYIYFGARFVGSSVAYHLLPVYCWSEPQQRLLWKGLLDNSP